MFFQQRSFAKKPPFSFRSKWVDLFSFSGDEPPAWAPPPPLSEYGPSLLWFSQGMLLLAPSLLSRHFGDVTLFFQTAILLFSFSTLPPPIFQFVGSSFFSERATHPGLFQGV